MLEGVTSERPNRIQELVYELKVGAVMTRSLISVEPRTMMSSLRTILRDNRISGTPVATEGRLEGIVSMEDFITWLAEGGKDCPVSAKMSGHVECIFDDEPLVHAVSKLDRFGFGRLPVLNRATGMLVGVITKGDIIEGLLRTLQIGHDEEEIQAYRASHFFNDMIADQVTIRFGYDIKGGAITDGGMVASGLKRSLKRLGLHPAAVRRAAIATYEAEMNVMIYAVEGKVSVTVSPSSISIEVADRGPGIPDVQCAMEPGFSTAPDWVRELGFGAGMGLPNIKSCAGSLEVRSKVGQGTSLLITIPMEGA
jgi:CBS domain-containing protein/anti-sigma regulatory factor (Ser/Thr protein kinase)